MRLTFCLAVGLCWIVSVGCLKEETPCLDRVVWEMAFSKSPDVAKDSDFRPVKIGYWQDQGYSATGFATYRMRLNCRPEKDTIRIYESSAAAAAYRNGTMLASSGTPGKTAEEERPRIAPWSVPIHEGDTLFYVSNHVARGGGILGYRFGKETDLEAERARSLYQEAMVLGMLNAAGFFFLIYFLARGGGAALPVFTLLMIVCTVRSAASNSVLEEWFPDRQLTDLRLRLEYLTALALMPPLYFWAIALLFQGDPETSLATLRRTITRILSAVYSIGAFCLSLFFIFARDASVYGKYQPEYVSCYLLPGLAVCLFLLFILVIEKRRGAGWMLLGFLSVLFSTLADAETTVAGQAGTLYVPLGLLGFAACFSVTVGIRIRSDFEELALTRKNLALSFEQDRRREQKRASEREQIVLQAVSALSRTASDFEEMLSQGKVQKDAAIPALSRLHSLRVRLEKRLSRTPVAPVALDVLRYIRFHHPSVRIPSQASLVVFSSRRELDRFIGEIISIHDSACTSEIVLLRFDDHSFALEVGILAPDADPDIQDLKDSGNRAGAVVCWSIESNKLIVYAEFRTPQTSRSLEERHAAFLSKVKANGESTFPF